MKCKSGFFSSVFSLHMNAIAQFSISPGRLIDWRQRFFDKLTSPLTA